MWRGGGRRKSRRTAREVASQGSRVAEESERDKRNEKDDPNNAGRQKSQGDDVLKDTRRASRARRVFIRLEKYVY